MLFALIVLFKSSPLPPRWSQIGFSHSDLTISLNEGILIERAVKSLKVVEGVVHPSEMLGQNNLQVSK